MKPSPRPPSASGTSIAVQPSSRALFHGCSGALPFSTMSRTSAVGTLAREHGAHRVDQLLLLRRDLEIHLALGSAVAAAVDAQHAPRHEQDLALVLARARPGSRDRTGTSSVSQGIAAKWNTVVAPIRLMKRCGSISGSSSPDATPSSISARNHSTGALPARTNGDTTPGCALAASRRIRRATRRALRHVVDPAGQRRLEPLDRAAARSAGRPCQPPKHLVEHRRVELLLVAEVVEDRGAPDADVGGDVLEPRGLEAALGEVALGGGHDLGAGLEAAAAARDGLAGGVLGRDHG